MRLASLLAFFLISACVHKPSNLTSLNDGFDAYRYEDLYFSGQPSQDDFRSLKDQGFVAVINLRQPEEYDEASEREQIASLGLAYESAPMLGSGPLSDEEVIAITAAVKKHKDKGKVLVHCGSGNRVAVWLGAHFHQDHGYSKQQASEKAKSLGLTKSGAEKKLSDYLSSK